MPGINERKLALARGVARLILKHAPAGSLHPTILALTTQLAQARTRKECVHIETQALRWRENYMDQQDDPVAITSRRVALILYDAVPPANEDMLIKRAGWADIPETSMEALVALLGRDNP